MAKDDPCHNRDKLGLFLLAGLVVLVLGGIAAGIFWADKIPDKADVLLATIATGLILYLRELNASIRASWEEVTRGKVNDQLARSLPDGIVPPQDAVTAGEQVAAAAERQSDAISEAAAR